MERHLALIRLLADGRYHSGEAIARHLGISRVAVWKALRKSAAHYGLALESVRGRGYRLPAPLELLDAERILASLSLAGHAGLARLDIHDQIDSTNAFLMREAAAGAPSGTACLAERQSAGRGRRGRVWVSPFGVNLYLSLLWRTPLAPSALGGASLAAGAVVADVLRTAGARDLALKWPNDLLWHGRKLAGLLLEVAGESQGPSHLVVGVGINLRMDPAQGSDIDQPWTDLRQVLDGRPLGRNELAARLLETLLAALETFDREGLEPFLDQWRDFDAFLGQPVRLLIGAETGANRGIEGIHAGIASDGSLQLETAEGLKRFQAGEVSLRM
ncbi:bifunctional biotin--[acetyl-CoA-carboxylase] ligase/biotin operon repressor BirA [uncultured Thiocystis sp.]|uniref:bifunctional biotin--[acetyl-CoA-carboxylase] ligase/biotin operon repressor BirA n=1 Tax=uncultured Thiocystis sp. TaxID=1202134 RepID=UPI0025CDB705|nr:bifunctional biotin--[acetyl-CoA-carboxylase] ligase/biotin operon repressor BirA [uncultured Thiocystis sp.]